MVGSTSIGSEDLQVVTGHRTGGAILKKAIIIGATSGIGRELARGLSERGYLVGVTGRRKPLLESLRDELPGDCFIREMDLTGTTGARETFASLVGRMGGVDLVIVNAGTGSSNPDMPWDTDAQTIAVNVAGFTAIANAAWRHFQEQGSGHLVGISSIAALRGGPGAPVYNASKAYVSSYLLGLQIKAAKEGLSITVTDVKPGFVDTAMGQNERAFWVASAEKAARQILVAIEQKRENVYITRRWRLIAWLIKLLPDRLYRKLMSRS
jgi:short-subunit dehydrogenase